MSHLVDIVDAYKKHSNRRPNWFSLFGGPNTVRDLAEHLDKRDLYDLLYREWSSTTHSDGGLQKIIRPHDAPGKIYIRNLRHPDGLGVAHNLTVNFLTQTVLLMTNRFREDEFKERNEWYKREVRSKLDAIEGEAIDEIDVGG